MAKDSIPANAADIRELQQPEKLSKVLAEDKFDDCLSCRVLGSSAFFGLGVYSYISGHRSLNLQRQAISRSGSRFGFQSRQTAITATSVLLVGMGLWRLVN